MKFYKEMMMERLKNEGRLAEVDAESLAIMDNLDGQEAIASCWNRVVYGEPVLYVKGKNGEGAYVNEADCR